ncbi:M23 family metallopeptidase [Candidatus Parcubacteria bacterium]|nr:M23 family metallopeptidase [Candidatus Parcubacteria bacterium]
MIVAFFVWLVFKPSRAILRLFFYKVVVRFYSFYRKILKRLGWKGLEQNAISFLFSQKLVHVLVIIVTILLIIVNVTPKTRAGGLTDRAHQTILADLIRSEFSEFEEDEQFIIESFDKEAVISSVQQTYLDNLDSFRPQARVSMGSEIEEEIDVATIQEGSSIVKPELAATKKTKRARTEIVEYVVLPGDTISTIAQAFEVSVRTILWENNKSSYSIIRPGDKLKILPMSGVSHTIKKGDSLNTIAKKYDVEEEKVMEANKLAKGGTLKIGQILMVPGGSKTSQPSYTTKTYTGFSAIKDIVKAPNAQAAAGNKMNWPTAATRITQYYSWRHHAVDIAAKTGTAIYASDAGIVEMVGWGSGYGNQIVINHGGNKKTRYAHLSKFYVSKGDSVSKGQTIAAMGSTGWSTGPHLHFEVIINGRKYNPLNYIR